MIFVGQESLRRAVVEYFAHYHVEHNHQQCGNQLDSVAPDCYRYQRDCASAAETRRDAQLLLPGTGVSGINRLFGQYEFAHE